MGKRVRIDTAGWSAWDGDPTAAPRHDRRLRLRTLMLLVLLVGVWLGLLFDPATGMLVGAFLIAAGVALGILLAGVALSFLGFGLFAVSDRVVAWARRGDRKG